MDRKVNGQNERKTQRKIRKFWKSLGLKNWKKFEKQYQEVLKSGNMAKVDFVCTNDNRIKVTKIENTENVLVTWRFVKGKEYTLIVGYESIFGYCEIYECDGCSNQFLAVIETGITGKIAVFLDSRGELIGFIDNTITADEVDMLLQDILEWKEIQKNRAFRKYYKRTNRIIHAFTGIGSFIFCEGRNNDYCPAQLWIDPEKFIFQMVPENDNKTDFISDSDNEKWNSETEDLFSKQQLSEICRVLYENDLIASADSQIENALTLAYHNQMYEVEDFDENIQEYYGSEVQAEQSQLLSLSSEDQLLALSGEFYFTCSSDFSEVEMKHIHDCGEGVIIETECLLSEKTQQTLKGKCMLFAYKKIAGTDACI